MSKCIPCVNYGGCKIRKVLPFVAEVGKCPKFKDLEDLL